MASPCLWPPSRCEWRAKRLHLRVNVADPHSPWKRPIDENPNALLRKYQPNSMGVSSLSRRHLMQVATARNAHPRNCLGLLTAE
jgi:IS30 family transposase